MSSSQQSSTTKEDKGSIKIAPSKAEKRGLLAYFPPWVSATLTNPRSLKTLLRCSLASWLAFVIILPNASLQRIGSAAFFALLTSLFLPPYLPVQLFLLLISTLVLGLLLGWGIGAAAMRAALASRNQALLQAAVAQVRSSPAFQTNPTLAQTGAIFSGVFLDIRSTAVYGGFLIFGSIIFALIRAYAPKLLFMSVFGTIALDIFCSFGPLFPTARYNLLNSTLISVGCAAGIGVILTIFIFPETMNHSSLTGLSGQLQRIQKMFDDQKQVLRATPADLVPGSPLYVKADGARTALIGGQTQWRATLGLISFEFSWGKWSGEDIKTLDQPFLELVVSMAGLQTFAKLIGESHANGQKFPSDTTIPLDSSSNDTYLLRQLRSNNKILETKHSVRIEDILVILDSCTTNLREACVRGLDAIQSTINHVNHRRWSRAQDSGAIDLDKAAEELRLAVSNFKETSRLTLLEPYEAMIVQCGDSAKEQIALPLRSLYVSYVFASNLIGVAEAALGIMESVANITAKRTKNRLWAPAGLRKIGKALREKDRGDEAEAFGEDLKPAEDDEEESYRRDPDSKPPKNLFQKIVNGLHPFYSWSKTAEATFVIKYAAISLALWVPAVHPRSANFYYVEKGVWALIMAQTTMTVYAADQIFNLFTRLIATVIGLILGLVGWYMGNGHGNGNPYGAAAAAAAMLVPLVFVRVFAPPKFLAGIILCCATFALIMGYSWVDGHYVQFASPGIGWSVAWKRFTLVVIGSAASFIIMMLPPSSGRKAVRLRNAMCITSLERLYGFLVAAWIQPMAEKTPEEEKAGQPAWLNDFRVKLFNLSDQLIAIRVLTDLADWESFRGAWPKPEYVRILELQREMTGALAQLGGALCHIDNESRVKYLHVTKVLNPHFISDVMSVFALVSQALRTGEPLHQVLPSTLLDRLFHHHNRQSTHIPDSQSVTTVMNVEQIRSLDLVYYATSVVAVYQLLQNLDELHQITKTLCGEVPLEGFRAWKHEYDAAHI
ncbi:hypothetical protein C8J56DRAFT_1013068 [Mycena floridula]|nr:hypothetical protein C8J56DRAFT_1013068 [Mycena floridula]